jgi:hypothetical protein
MEKLILKSGRFIPPALGDVETRVKLIEAHLSGLTEELEYLVGEMDRALNALEAAISERDGLVAVTADTPREEGGL